MRGSKYKTIAALLSATAVVASAVVAQAQVTKADAKCRATAHKHTAKLTASASKASAGCWKNVLTGKRGFTNCNDSATADVTFKVAKAATKLTDAVGGGKTKCDDMLHSAALAEYQDCPSPGTQGTGMTTFAQVGLCLRDVGHSLADNMHRAAMNPGAKEVTQILADTVNGKQIAKCGNSIQKSFNKLIATIGKVEGRQQTKILDKAAIGATNLANNMSAAGRTMQRVGIRIAAAGAAITAGLGLAVRASMKFEDAFTGVRKTVDASEADFAILEKGLVSLNTPLLKILGNGECLAKFTIRAQKLSKSATAKIEAAGGSVVLIDAKGRELSA